MRTHRLEKVAKRGSVDVGSKRNTCAEGRGIYVTFIEYFWLVSLAYIVLSILFRICFFGES